MNSAILIDTANLHYCVGKKFEGRRLDYTKYLEFLNDPRWKDKIGNLKWKIAYGIQQGDEATSFITKMKYLGFDNKYISLSRRRVITTRVDLIMDVVKLIPKIDILILGINNHDYIDLIKWVKEQGVKCGLYGARISNELKGFADFYIEVTEGLLI